MSNHLRSNGSFGCMIWNENGNIKIKRDLKWDIKKYVAFLPRLWYDYYVKKRGVYMKENKYLEFKSEVTNTFLKTVSAFSNFGDGKILFGVNFFWFGMIKTFTPPIY